MKDRNSSDITTTPVEPDKFAVAMPEHGRVADVQRLFGLKRGSCYNLLRDGKIKGVLLRVRGKKSGIRIFDLQSIRDFIRSQMTGEH
jgi:hypothetical protein